MDESSVNDAMAMAISQAANTFLRKSTQDEAFKSENDVEMPAVQPLAMPMKKSDAAGHENKVGKGDKDGASKDEAIPSGLALKVHLASHPSFQRVPIELIDRFVAAPSQMMRLSDVCATLHICRATCRAHLRSAGFERAEHLHTALRAEAWIWFAQRGWRRAVFEKYLGIRDRKTFRRACCRAAVTVPWQDCDVCNRPMAPPNGKSDSIVRSAPPNARSAPSGA